MTRSTFPVNWSEEIISCMQRYYSVRFSNTFPMHEGQTDEDYKNDLIETACEVFEGLTPENIQRGLAKMKRSKFCPVFPEFRQWCEPECDGWLGANEAWAIARYSVDFDGKELTVIWTEQASKAFSLCSELVKTGDKYQLAEAKKIFCDAYERLVTQAKDKGLKPVYITSLGVDKDQAIAAIKQAETDGFLPSPVAQSLLEHKQTTAEIQSDSLKYKTVAQEALEKLGKVIKRDPVNKIAEIEQVENKADWETVEIKHIDPFDDFNEYKKNIEASGKKLPHAVRYMAEREAV